MLPRIAIERKGENLDLSRIELADSVLSRMKGLLGRNKLDDAHALLITRCNQVHTMGMNFPIDIVFIDRNFSVNKVVENLKPYRLAVSLKSKYTLELAAGTAQRLGIKENDKLSWVPYEFTD